MTGGNPDPPPDPPWQMPKGKRTLPSSSPPPATKRPHFDTKNRFSPLQDAKDNSTPGVSDQEDESMPQSSQNTPKPPPIFLENVVNITLMLSSIRKIVSNNEFSYKALPDGTVKLNTFETEAYRSTVKYLKDTNIKFHTYQLKNERAFRVVLKGLHHSSDTTVIKSEIEKHGHKVKNITVIINRFTKQPYNLFYLDLLPETNNKEIYLINKIENAVVTVEPPIKSKNIVQCYRCQELGHTKAYCFKQFCCLKCGEEHDTTVCKKPNNVPAVCANCGGDHPANFKRCRYYLNVLSSRSPQSIPKPVSAPTPGFNNAQFPLLNNRQSAQAAPIPQTMLYSQALTNDQVTDNNNSILSKLEQLMIKQSEMMNTLINMMSLLINKFQCSN